MNIENNLEIKTYLDEVCSYIKCKEVHEQIKLELLDHFEELLQNYLESGLTLEESINNVLQNMGDPILIGKQLNSAHKAKPEWSIIGLSFVFSLVGLLALFFIKSSDPYLNSAFYKSAIFSLLGIAIVFCLYFFDYRKLKKYSKAIYIITLCLLLIIFLFPTYTGETPYLLRLSPIYVNYIAGVPYLHIFPFRGYIDFVYISPILFVIALSGIFVNWNWKDPKKFILGFILNIIPVILLIYSHSLIPLCTYIAAFIVLMISSKTNLYKVLSIIVGFFSIFSLYIFSSSSRMKRFFSFILSSNDLYTDDGWINGHIKKLLDSAGLWGNNPYTIKIKYPLFNMHNHFIFTYITYIFGWIAAICLISLIFLFLIHMFKASEKIKDDYGQLLVKGFLSILSFKFTWNILMNLGLFPIASINLPFISYGGTEFILNMIIVGLISSIYRLKSVNHIPKQKKTLNIK